MDLKSLDVAIKDFNDWEGPARIYYNKEDKYFTTGVYHNGIDQAQTMSTDEFVQVFHKGEFDNYPINNRRREYIIEFARMVDGGYPAADIMYIIDSEDVYL